MTKCLRQFAAAAAVVALPLTSACDFEELSNAEMRAAVDEIVLTGEAQSLEDGIVEITTSFTIGDGVANVLAEVQAFAESQVPCSKVSSPAENTLSIDFGELGDSCTYNGKTYAGVVTVAFEITGDAVIVTHDYDAVTNGRVTMDGNATVTWSPGSRHVETAFTFTGKNAKVEVDSDRTQTVIGGIGDGIRVAGERNWHGPSGSWNLDINDVEIRAADPVPQSGSYVLTTPNGKELTLSFTRVDDDTIEVRISRPRRDHVFHVTSTGGVSDEGEA